MRLLLVAPACDGDDVGEAWVAYQWARALADVTELTVLSYHKRGHRTVREQLPDHVHVVEWTEPPLLGRAERFNSLLKPAYVPFYIHARAWMSEQLRRGRSFDVAHQVSPVAMRYPTPLAHFPIPYVLGPVAGSLERPPAFQEGGDTSPWYSRLRELDAARRKYDPLLRSSYKNASLVLGTAPYVEHLLTDCQPRRFEVLADTGIASLPQAMPAPEGSRKDDRWRVVFVGRVIRTKGVRELVKAIAALGRRDVIVDVIGDGFDRTFCQELASRLGVQGQFVWHGRIPHADVSRHLVAADLFVFPSYQEPGGTAVWEALAHGLPCVVADRGGPASTVTDDCGVRVPVTDPDDYAAALARAIVQLLGDNLLRRRMSDAARQRAQQGLWEFKVDRALRYYGEITG